MTFSLRELLAAVLLCALGLLAWRTWEGAKREHMRLAQVHNEIKSLEASLRLDQPALHRAILHEHDEFNPLSAMRKRSLARFEELRHKYSALEQRGGDVFSIRGLPSLSLGAGPAPIVLRFCVPQEHPVWLKFGVHRAQRSVHSSRSPDDDRGLLSESPFQASGPFEMRLPPGEQTLTITTAAARNGSMPLRIALDHRVLLRSSFIAAGIAGAGSSQISVPEQLDFGPQQKLPWLLTTHINLSNIKVQEVYAFSMWLSDRASQFQAFPGDDRRERDARGARQ